MYLYIYIDTATPRPFLSLYSFLSFFFFLTLTLRYLFFFCPPFKVWHFRRLTNSRLLPLLPFTASPTPNLNKSFALTALVSTPQSSPSPNTNRAHTLTAESRRLFNTSTFAMGRENIQHYLQEQTQDPVKELDISSGRNSDDESSAQEKPNPKRVTTSHSNFPFTLSKDSTITDYLNNNKYFIDSIQHNHGLEIFDLNSKGQSPHTLWIGCSDSRAGDGCLATLPGEVFVHRNIANIINANDISSQGVIQFAIDVLKVRKIIVCGHTDCGGVWASLSSKKIGGVLDLWLNPVRHIRAQNLDLLNQLNSDPRAKAKKLAELNVISSVTAIKRHPSATQALKEGKIEVWGMMYDVATGYLSEVEIPTDEFHDLFHVHDEEVAGEHNAH